jgi:cullin-associated NEDD8-dissociated protein 1
MLDDTAFAHDETSVRKELIDEIDLGPFKHKVDRGLPLRKAAFQLLETLFNRASDQVDVLQIVDAIVNSGLTDTEEESVVLTLNVLEKISKRACVVVFSRIEQITAAFEKLFSSNFKLISQKQS